MWKKAHQQLQTMSKQYAAQHMLRSTDALNRLPKDLRSKVEQTLARFVAIIPRDLDPEKKVALLYHVLTSQITYDRAGMDTTRLPYTFIGALCRKKAVCMGIAELFTYLCTLLDVKAVTVIGCCCSTKPPADTEEAATLHAWVMVRLTDHCWYHLDPTWDIHKADIRNWQPRWFLLSDEEMARHYWLKEDYPNAPTRFQENIELDQKGVEILCRHWQNLTAQFA